MISADALGAWQVDHPWADFDQVEQDLIMTRVAIEVSEHPTLRDRLAWRGGTCLHKLFLPKALRFSEDLDYVAYDLSIEANDMRTLRIGLREVAESVELSVAKNAKTTRTRLTEHLGYVDHRGQERRLKIEINLDEVPAVHPSIGDGWKRTATGGAEAPTSSPSSRSSSSLRSSERSRNGARDATSTTSTSRTASSPSMTNSWGRPQRTTCSTPSFTPASSERASLLTSAIRTSLSM